jgi:hypothetical protein
MRSVIVTLDEFIECAVKIGLPARRALELARESGYRVRDADFYQLYREAVEQWAA